MSVTVGHHVSWLRPNLYIGSRGENGGNYYIQDPINQQYFEFSDVDIYIVQQLQQQYKKQHAIDISDVVIRVNKKYASLDDSILNYDSCYIEGLIAFLKQHHLLSANDDESKQLLQQHFIKNNDINWKHFLSQSYLFQKIPLFESDKFLSQLTKIIEPLINKKVAVLIAMLACLGIFLSLRNFQQFSLAFQSLLTGQGMLLFAVMLILVKFLHELGHGVAAKYHGCEVPTIGLAFIVFWPILYTDTTDSWKLPSHQQRLSISLAGIVVELSIAGLCLFFWHFLSAGLFKDVIFLLATSTWVMTLLVNLNPLMKFDGYFALADFMKVDNLQSRSYALGRWYLRRVLFGYQLPPPEAINRFMLVYAYLAWLYRIIIFISISLLIYHLFFKALGLLLLVSYTFFSFLKPIINELFFCIKNRQHMKFLPNSLISLSLLLMLLVYIFLPVRNTVSLPAYYQQQQAIPLYAPFSGRITSIANSKSSIKLGEKLVVLDVADIEQQLVLAKLEQQSVAVSLKQAMLDSDKLSEIPRLKQELSDVLRRMNQFELQLQQRYMLAPFDGLLTDKTRGYEPGGWVKKGALLAYYLPDNSKDKSSYEVIAYANEQQIRRLSLNARATFYTGGKGEKLVLHLAELPNQSVDFLNEPYLLSVYGGELSVAAKTDQEGWKPNQSLYKLRFITKAPLLSERVLEGVIRVEAEQESMVHRMINNIVGIWRRESVF